VAEIILEEEITLTKEEIEIDLKVIQEDAETAPDL